jgi:DNA recombination protein RmuC
MMEAAHWGTLVVAIAVLFLQVCAIVWLSRHLKESGKDVRSELQQARYESQVSAKNLREEVSQAQRSAHDTLSTALNALGSIRDTIDNRIKELQAGNERKLDEMQRIVDQKLHETLENRLRQSFGQVSEHLEAVQKGLGEMQNLATDVGGLRRVLTNVKARGTWAEVQMGAILDQILAPQQFDRNVQVKPDSSDTIEYAVRLPGPKDAPSSCVWLPIDAKFPQEDYLRLQDAQESGDTEAASRAAQSLARTVRAAAKDVTDKYVAPPHTTDFAILFLATEGLYAEILRQPKLVDDLLLRHRVVIAGPTTLAAILSSLSVGFQTLAIKERAGEVWKVLAAVKVEFGKFGEVLDRVRRQLNTASRSLDDTDRRTRAMERQLRVVEQLPNDQAGSTTTLGEAKEAKSTDTDDAPPF